jgi:hypothetical protein
MNSKFAKALMITLVLLQGCAVPGTPNPFNNLPTNTPPPAQLENPYQNYPYWYKGQTHAHSTESGQLDVPDPRSTPANVEKWYRDRGYTFIALTDHNSVTSDPGVGCEPGTSRCILHIPSGEDGWTCRHHMIVINPSDWDLVSWGDHWACLSSDIQSRIDTFTGSGALVVLAHPAARWDPPPLGIDLGTSYEQSELLNNRRYTGIEIRNPGVDSVDWWDKVLSLGQDRRIWGFASDDCENYGDELQETIGIFHCNEGWIVVNSDKGPAVDFINSSDPAKQNELRENILRNIASGNFYAVFRTYQNPGPAGASGGNTNDNPPHMLPAPMAAGANDLGPMLKIQTAGSTITVQTDANCKNVKFVGSNGRVLKSDSCYAQGGPYFSDYYFLDGTEQYVRIEVSQELLTAYSQPLYVISHGADNTSNSVVGEECTSSEKCCGSIQNGHCRGECVSTNISCQ